MEGQLVGCRCLTESEREEREMGSNCSRTAGRGNGGRREERDSGGVGWPKCRYFISGKSQESSHRRQGWAKLETHRED